MLLCSVCVNRQHAAADRSCSIQVQHPGLLDTYAVDVATVSILVHAVHLLFPAFDYSWLVTEIKNTLPKVSPGGVNLKKQLVWACYAVTWMTGAKSRSANPAGARLSARSRKCRQVSAESPE